MKQSKAISSSLLVFFNSFLIVSTVIVFAVLLFLSYESMNSKLVDDCRDDAQNGCYYVSEDVAMAMNGLDSFSTESLINYMISTPAYSQYGNIYVVDEEGVVYYQCVNDHSYALTGNVTGRTFRIIDKEIVDFIKEAMYSSEQQTAVTSRSDTVRTRSCRPIEGTDYACLIVNSTDVTEARNEFTSIILVPALIALIVAVILFVAFVEISMRPINEISRVISKVSTGDYSSRIEKKYTDVSDMSVLTVSADVSEMAATINNMLEVLENQEKDRNIFISSIAHDIRTPLTSINGFVTAMLDGTIPPENQEKYLNLIKNEADRIRRLVTSMTEASSLSHVDPELMEEFNLEEVLDDTIENLIPQTSKKNITIKTNLELIGDGMVYGEAQQLCRVVVNIISNAIKFTPMNGTIKVTAIRQEAEKNMKISVEDSGSGVDEDKRSRIFESFYKADPSRKQEGFGLGLYICKQILVGHGQSIMVDESKELGGAAFIFSFPLPPEEK